MSQVPDVASVIIPAYNEGSVIAACLEALVQEASAAERPLRLEIVVAANGCTDDTVARCRAFAEVTVLDLPVGNKSAALNAADAMTEVFPRIYLDADVVLSPGTLAALVSALSTPAPRMAAPSAEYVLDDASWPVRAFHRVFTQLPYAESSLGGVGVYAVSAAGRARWDRFPDVHGDDLYVQRQFSAGERLRVPGSARVKAPKTVGSLVAVRTRIARGNQTLARVGAETGHANLGSSTRQTMAALGRSVLRRPSLAPAAAVYVGITLAARLRARTSKDQTWLRDDTTRDGPAGPQN